MSTGRKYHRVSNGVFAGVCGGLAETLDMDALPLRVLAVLLLLTTFGVFGLVYLMAVFAWPCEYRAEDRYDLKDSADATLYQHLNGEYVSQMGPAGSRRPDAPPSMGHVPPLPPRLYVERYGTAAVPFFQYARLWMAGQVPSSSEARSAEDLQEERDHSDRTALVLIVLGAFILMTVLNMLVNQMLLEPARLNLQPFFLVLLGLSVIMAPMGNLPVSARVVEGLSSIALGLFGTLVFIDVLSISMLGNPLVVGITVLQAVLTLAALKWRTRWAFVLVAVCTLVFLSVTFVFAHVPGTLTQMTLYSLFGDPTTLILNPWR